MQQLEIQYFFPLTEQIPLDLDFKPCQQYDEEKRAIQFSSSIISGSYLMCNGSSSTWATVSLKDTEPNFTINIDAMPITIQSKTKPNFFRRYIYKILGMKWKAA